MSRCQQKRSISFAASLHFITIKLNSRSSVDFFDENRPGWYLCTCLNLVRLSFVVSGLNRSTWL